MIIDFSNPWMFLVWYIITVLILFASYKLKKSWISLISVAYFLLILAISIRYNDSLLDVAVHRTFNFLGLAFSICMFVVMDEVETRRKVISQVFKNRYKRNKKNDEELENEDEMENEEG